MTEEEYEIFCKVSGRSVGVEEAKHENKPEDLNIMIYDDIVSPRYFDKSAAPSDKKRDEPKEKKAKAKED